MNQIELPSNSGDLGSQQKKPLFELLTVEDLRNRPPLEPLVHGYLFLRDMSLITAKYGSYKSFIALWFALCVALGMDWCGKPVKQGAVIYVAAEGASGLLKRILAFCIHHGCEPPMNLYIIDEGVQMRQIQHVSGFVEIVAPLEPVLIVFDTWALCTLGSEENSTTEANLALAEGRHIATVTGAHVCYIHHNNKNNEYRGSTAIPATVDTHISMETSGEDSVTLTMEKQKNFEKADPIVAQKRLVCTGGQGTEHSLVFEFEAQITGSRWVLGTNEQRVLNELVESFGSLGATTSKWEAVCKEIGIPGRTFARAKSALLNKFKAVECDNPRQRGAIYRPKENWCQSLPDGADGSDGTDYSVRCQTLPHSFRSGSDGSDSSQVIERQDFDDDADKIFDGE